MNIKSLKPKPNFDIEPDLEDPNPYCKSCDYKLKRFYNYRLHLRDIHKIVLKSLSKKPKPNYKIEPGQNDPNHYCKSCDYKFSNRYGYLKHLGLVHQIGVTPVDLDTEEDLDANLATFIMQLVQVFDLIWLLCIK
jgi:transposase-like protein